MTPYIWCAFFSLILICYETACGSGFYGEKPGKFVQNMSESSQTQSFILILGRVVLGVTYAMVELGRVRNVGLASHVQLCCSNNKRKAIKK